MQLMQMGADRVCGESRWVVGGGVASRAELQAASLGMLEDRFTCACYGNRDGRVVGYGNRDDMVAGYCRASHDWHGNACDLDGTDAPPHESSL